jgi:hypothetical protein
MFEQNRQEQQDPNELMEQLMKQLHMDDSVIRAQINDQRLVKMAEYDVTRGYTKSQVLPESLQSKFAEFKTLIKRGSFTLEELESDVFSRWGIQEPPRSIQKKGVQITGFSMADIQVARIPEYSPENR